MASRVIRREVAAAKISLLRLYRLVDAEMPTADRRFLAHRSGAAWANTGGQHQWVAYQIAG